MPPILPHDSQLKKRSERRKLLSAITAVAIISMHPTILPLHYSRLPHPMRIGSLSGRQYIDEILSCSNPRRYQEVFRMKTEVFEFLCFELEIKGGLGGSKHVAVDEKVGMFF